MNPSNPTNSQPLIYRIADALGVFHLVAPVDHTHTYAEVPGLQDDLSELWAGLNEKANQEDMTEALAAKGEDGKLGLLVVTSMQDPYLTVKGCDKKPTAYILSEEKNLEQIAVKYENGVASVVVPTGNIIYFEA